MTNVIFTLSVAVTYSLSLHTFITPEKFCETCQDLQNHEKFNLLKFPEFALLSWSRLESDALWGKGIKMEPVCLSLLTSLAFQDYEILVTGRDAPPIN